MREELVKLERLITVHNKIADWHLENIAGLEASIAACDQDVVNTHVAMEKLEGMRPGKGPNFSRILKEIKERRAKLEKSAMAAKAEHARISAIVEHLLAKQAVLREENEQRSLEESIDEWSNAQASFS